MNTSFFQLIILVFLLFLLFGDFNKLNFNFEKLKSFFSYKNNQK